MLDQLVESKGNKRENKTRGGYMLTTSVLIVGLLFSSLTWSLFAKDLKIGEGNLDVSTLVAPIVENAPVPVVKQQKSEPLNTAKSAMISRQTNMLRIDENPLPPKEVSVMPNTQKARPNGSFIVADNLAESDGSRSNISGRESVGGESDIQINQSPIGNVKNSPLPPPEFKKPPVAETAPKLKTTIASGGVVNGKAKFLPKPIYSAAAKAVRAGGDVNVQVMIDESGNVVSANAVSGHPLLKIEAEKAARSAKFNPTFLSKQPVKVSGVIVYKFSMQ